MEFVKTGPVMNVFFFSVAPGVQWANEACW